MPVYTSSCWADFQGRPISRVVQLGRVSGLLQKQEETIKTQVSVMDAFCRMNGWIVLDRFLDEDCENETPLELRSEAGRLWRRLSSPDFQAIIVYTVDRWSREPHVFWPSYWHARSRGVRLISATQAMDDTTDEGLRLVLPVLLAVGSYEKSQIASKLLNGRRRMLDERYVADGEEFGYWIGGCVPYGYMQTMHGRRHVLVPDETTLPGLLCSPAEVIRWIYQWLVEEHLTARRIADRLNDRGIPTYAQLPAGPGRRTAGSTSNYWQPGTVTAIVKNSIYRGEHRWGKRRDGRLDRDRGPTRPMPALVAPAVWHAAQEVLRENQTWANRNSKRQYLLRGFIKCATPGCSHTFYGHQAWSRGKPVEGQWYYTCRGHLRRKFLEETRGVRCRTTPLRGEDVEQLVLAELQGFLDNPHAAAERLRRQIQERTADTGAVQQEIDERRAERAQKAEARRIAQRALLSGRFTEAEFDERVGEIESDEERLDAEIREREAILTQSQNVEAHLTSAQRFLEGMQAEIGSVAALSFERQRQLLEAWLQDVVVYPAETEGEDQTVIANFWFRDPAAIAENISRIARYYLAALAVPIQCLRRMG